MQKTAIGLIVTACLGAFDVASATYVIKLKNGNEYVTNRYWQEGTQVLFDTYGGVFGIDKAFVGKIEKTDQVIKLASVVSQNPADKSPAEAAKETQDKETTSEKPEKKERDANDPIVSEFSRFKERSKDVSGMATEEIRALLKEIVAFKNRFSKERNLYREYSREFNDIHEVSSVVEDALRERTR